uniref:Uncharacterized protein n=1 Tax=Felis catus TaxID=9685 RepID=A0ABI7Z9M1_FELCA
MDKRAGIGEGSKNPDTTCSGSVGKSVRCPWRPASPAPNTPAPPASTNARVAPSSDSRRRCRTARTVCRPRSRLPSTGAPRGWAGTPRCRNTSRNGSLRARRAGIPGGSGQEGRGWGVRVGESREESGRDWEDCQGGWDSGAGATGTFPRAPRSRRTVPSLLPHRCPFFPTPHSPAQVWVTARAPDSKKESQEGSVLPGQSPIQGSNPQTLRS